jgi:hypothetical protein
VQLNKNKQRVPFIKQFTILLLLIVLNYFPIPIIGYFVLLVCMSYKAF